MGSLKSLIFFALVAVFWPEVTSQIIGGYDAAFYQFTYQVSIRGINKRHICSGSILSEQWVITTARCVQNAKEDALEISYGSRFLSVHAKKKKSF